MLHEIKKATSGIVNFIAFNERYRTFLTCTVVLHKLKILNNSVFNLKNCNFV